MNLGLNGKVALVAAATKGLGFAVARELVLEGAMVAICGRNKEILKNAEAHLKTLGNGEVLAYPADVSQQNQVDAWVRRTIEKFGGIDIVVTNNGGVPLGRASEFSPQEYQDAVSRVMLPAIRITQAALPYLIESHAGRVLIMTSDAIRRPPAHLALSSVARSGLVSYAQLLVQELRGRNITVNVLAPGAHRTTLHQNNQKGNFSRVVKEVEERIPVGRIGEPEEFAAVATFLASERASYISGNLIMIDGGLGVSVCHETI